MSAPVVFAVQQGDALRVYVRNGDAELRQVAQTAVNVADVDPVHLVTLVADLDAQLGWTGHAAAGGRVLGHPAVAALAAADSAADRPVKKRGYVGRQQPEAVAARRARALRLFDKAPAEGLSRVEVGAAIGYASGNADFSSWVKQLVATGRLVQVSPGGGPLAARYRGAAGDQTTTDDQTTTGPTPTRAQAKKLARQAGASQGRDRRDRLLTMLRERAPEPVSSADFSAVLLPGERQTGALHMTLQWLVDHGQAVRSGESGSYRWTYVEQPATEATG
jgi:hypothetical protein